ncbi:MAG: YicC/YloC family endoribonuclease [Pseudomonadota bacterium]
MLRSMTGFAAGTGSLPPHSWSWELRSVNGKGQDLRLRVPDWIDGLEMQLRKMLADSVVRGNVTLSLRVARDDLEQTSQINTAQLNAAFSALSVIEEQARAAGLTLRESSAIEIAALRGVLDAGSGEDDTTLMVKQLAQEARVLISQFDDMRSQEGAALARLLSEQLNEIEALTSQAETLAEARLDETRVTLQRNLARVLDNSDGVEEDRLIQELALIAVKADVTEELDRLRTHLEAARDMISKGGAVGRPLGFLMQEFFREANTLCAKSQNAELTRCGLALKTVIDQMREQVQNVE